MRKSYIKRLDNYCEKICALEQKADDVEWEANDYRRRGWIGKADSLMDKAMVLNKRAWSWDERAEALIQKMTEEEFNASKYGFVFCVSYEECIEL